MVKARGPVPDPFFCVNSDNVWIDGPKDAFRELSDAWHPARMDALLLLVAHTGARNFAGKGDFHMDGARTAHPPPLGTDRAVRVSPASSWSPSACCAMRRRGRSRPTCCGTRAIGEGRLYGAAFTGQWFEVGNPGAIAPTEAALAGRLRKSAASAVAGSVSNDASFAGSR
jgi:MurNAc alpha-1-phosphate uridylyltransferase